MKPHKPKARAVWTGCAGPFWRNWPALKRGRKPKTQDIDMLDLNDEQSAYMARFPGRELSDLPPEVRLEVANLAKPTVIDGRVDEPTADEPTADAEPAPTPAQIEYLNAVGLPLAELTPAQKDDYDFWGRLGAIIRKDAPAEVAKPLPEEPDAPVVVDAHSVLDPELIKDLSPVRKAGLADALVTVKRGTRIGDGLSQATSLERAKFYLAPFVKRKR
ncbi:hypothetical protein [Mesorhizobium sp. M0678]|uniref:hypothetical protein n=1 Tax=Mesorhizobium sp. M0678 TaxID=2956985 RepID=UPI00333AE74B